MRKYLIVALAGVAAISFSAVALGQGADTATLNVKVTPKKAGTKKKPKNATYTLDVVNDNSQRTMSDLDVFLAKNVKLSLKGLPKCDPDTIFAIHTDLLQMVVSPGMNMRVYPTRHLDRQPMISYNFIAFRHQMVPKRRNVLGRADGIQD